MLVRFKRCDVKLPRKAELAIRQGGQPTRHLTGISLIAAYAGQEDPSHTAMLRKSRDAYLSDLHSEAGATIVSTEVLDYLAGKMFSSVRTALLVRKSNMVFGASMYFYLGLPEDLRSDLALLYNEVLASLSTFEDGGEGDIINVADRSRAALSGLPRPEAPGHDIFGHVGD